jgi:hypothetical protein
VLEAQPAEPSTLWHGAWRVRSAIQARWFGERDYGHRSCHLPKAQSKQELAGLSRERRTLAVAKDRAAVLSTMLGRPVSVAEAIDAAMMVATPEQMAELIRSIPPARIARRGRPKSA